MRRTARTNTEESDVTSPASLVSVMSAFQNGLRKKATKDDHWEERQQAIEAENATQERIRRRMPGRKQTGPAKAGDIDGEQWSL